jgi:hypothetical protein
MSATISPSNVRHESHRSKTFKKMKENASKFFNKISRPKKSKIYIGEDIPDETIEVEDINLDIETKKSGGKRRRTGRLRQKLTKKTKKNKRRTRR